MSKDNNKSQVILGSKSLRLVEAAKNGRTKKVKALLDAGAWDDDAVLFAAVRDHAETLRVLIENIPPTQDRNDLLRGAMTVAVPCGCTEAVKVLLDAGAKDDEALFWAISFEQKETVKVLLDAGVEIDEGALSNAEATEERRREILPILRDHLARRKAGQAVPPPDFPNP